MTQNLGIRVHFARVNDSLSAKIDIPMQNAFGLPLTNVRCVPPAVAFDLQAGPGLAVFRGTMAGDSIAGRFEQAGFSGTFFLTPAREDTAAGRGYPVPYSTREVTFKNDSITLAGTLTVPAGIGPFPGLVMVTGSGPQNRDEEIFGFKLFGIIADSLTRSGIAVLRYDDRGVGGSTGRFADAATTDFAADAEAGVDFLMWQEAIRKDCVGMLGHSEGGIASAMVAARRPDVNFLILLATPAISGDSLIDFQVLSAARRARATHEELRRILSLQHRTYETVRRRTGFDSLEALLVEEAKRGLERLPAESRSSIPDSLIRSRVGMQMASLKSRWFREFIMFDPSTALSLVTCPVLGIFAEADQQVPPAHNRTPMEDALRRARNTRVTIHTVPRANHLFLHSTTGDPSEYATIKKEIVPGFLTAVSAWLRDTVVGR